MAETRMSLYDLETLLVALSVFIMVGYHCYLWYFFKHRPSTTTPGCHALMRKQWMLCIRQGDEKKEMLAVQSIRNTQMTTIFTATVAILVNAALPALTNNVYTTSSHLSMMWSPLWGSQQSGRVTVLKYGSVSVALLSSYLCSSLGLGYLMDANFLVNATVLGGGDDGGLKVEKWAAAHTERVMERGFRLGELGNRILCVSFPLMAWLLGPIPLAVASVGMVWILYSLDFRSGYRSD
ncbi:hypothetical protein LINPERHAP1_LOCUS12077 [Linum perenne]